MNRQPWGSYPIAVAVLVVGLVALGLPASTLAFATFVLAWPLMMIFTMRGMPGGAAGPSHAGPSHAGHADANPTNEDHRLHAGTERR